MALAPQALLFSSLAQLCPTAASDSRKVPEYLLLWLEIRLRPRAPIAQQEHTALRVQSFVLAWCSQLAPGRMYLCLPPASRVVLFSLCSIRKVSRGKGRQDRCRVRSAWFGRLPPPDDSHFDPLRMHLTEEVL